MTTTTTTFFVDPAVAAWSITMAEYLATNPFPGVIIDGIGTSILVFSPSPTTPRILLLRRAPTDSMPDLWEVPGGGVDADDVSILAGAARELLEEAGLTAVSFVRVVPQKDERTNFAPREDSWFPSSTGTKRWAKVAFIATVPEEELEGVNIAGMGAVKTDPKEHSAAFWATEQECLAKQRESDGMELVFTPIYDQILEGFRIWKAVLAERKTI